MSEKKFKMGVCPKLFQEYLEEALRGRRLPLGEEVFRDSFRFEVTPWLGAPETEEEEDLFEEVIDFLMINAEHSRR